jgi:hypothetical protein
MEYISTGQPTSLHCFIVCRWTPKYNVVIIHIFNCLKQSVSRTRHSPLSYLIMLMDLRNGSLNPKSPRSAFPSSPVPPSQIPNEVTASSDKHLPPLPSTNTVYSLKFHPLTRNAHLCNTTQSKHRRRSRIGTVVQMRQS